MPPPNLTLSAPRNGYGLAADRTQVIPVKWNAFRQSVATGETKRFLNSAGFWAHTAFVLAHPGNAADIDFGPTSLADTRVLAPGTEYQIPPIYPWIEGTWTAFDLGDWYFRCDTAPATIIVMYV